MRKQDSEIQNIPFMNYNQHHQVLEINPEEDQINSQNVEDLNQIMNYKFNHFQELGHNIERFNGAKRVDFTRDVKKNIIKSPSKLLSILNTLYKNRGQFVSYGLKLNNHIVHFILENQHQKIGIYFFDQQRVINIKQIIMIEKAKERIGLDQVIIISNNFSNPARQLLTRLNDQTGDVYQIHYLNSFYQIN